MNLTPLKLKLEFPHFFVAVEDLADHVRQAGVPVCRGRVRFRGSWPDRPEATVSGHLQIKATFGVVWDGFYLGYEVTADVPPEAYGRTRLSVDELRNLSIRYTDDRLEAQTQRHIPVEELIELLRRPENRVPPEYAFGSRCGECPRFSVVLNALMFRGAEVRQTLLQRLDDPEIRNEAVVLLGVVGDEATVPELIARYPRGPVPEPSDWHRDPGWLTRVCLSCALCWLTVACLDRAGDGTLPDPYNAAWWEKWWAENRSTFRVSAVKPRGLTVAYYTLVDNDHVARIQSMFVESGDNSPIDYE